MISPHRLTACAACVCALASLSLALWLPAEWEGEPVDPSPGPAGPGHPGDPLGEVLTRPSDLYLRRFRHQGEAWDELRAGRLSLLEAAMRFRELGEAGPPFDWEGFRRLNPGRTDEERFCRLVLGCAPGALSGNEPSRRTLALGRLEREWQEYLAALGPDDFPGAVGAVEARDGGTER